MKVGVIPARYAATRLPGKPLVDLGGQTMVERVWRAASAATTLDQVLVATDDERIADVVRGFGGDAELTDPNLPSGTDRCYAAIVQRGWQPSIVVNIQGDEPLLQAHVVDDLVLCIQKGNCDVATPIQRIADNTELLTQSVVKVAVAEDFHALYFTRAPIATHWKHVGLYAYTWQALTKHITTAPSQLEGAEKLEQLRLLEAGARFVCVETTVPFRAIDTPDDIEPVLQLLALKG